MLSVDHVLTSREVAWQHALTSKLNVFYYQAIIGRWTRWGLRGPRMLRQLLVEYVQHAHRFSMLYQFGGSDDELKGAVDLFTATEACEAALHPNPDQALIEKCRQEVLTSIGV